MMSLYKRYIIPRMIDSFLSIPAITAMRKETLQHVDGKILEIGFGTGLNLPCYPPHVKEITIIEPNIGMNQIAQRRISHSSIMVHRKVLNAESLPFMNESFDSIVSTFTFCSISNLDMALQEFHRVLKPNGRLFFLEHGLSPDQSINFWQSHLNPVYTLFSDGCNLNRDMKQIIMDNNFVFLELHQGYLEDMTKIAGFLSRGIAIKNSKQGLLR